MGPPLSLDADAGGGELHVLWEDAECALYRGRRTDEKRKPRSVLALRLTAERPRPTTVDRLAHEYRLRDHLQSAWAARPLELLRDRDRTMLVLEDPGGVPLDRYLGQPMEAPRFLELAINIAAALRQVHQSGLIHRDLKPAHILVDDTNEHVRLTGFGLASQLPRERQLPGPPEFIAGSLPYMAPEQTGRMNRSIDSRSDLYALGTVFYQMLTGVLPFTTSDPMEWVHCQIARMPLPPHERVPNIPAQISHIVFKLLAKTADERYQTAAGVERDLRRCLVQWQAKGRIDPFTAGEADTPDRLLIPEKLYGRQCEIALLLDTYHRVATTGAPELMLISGYSGIGKSSVVNELHKALVPSRGLFASGKSDQHKRDIPYATVAQAFQGLIGGLLSTSDADLDGWRRALRGALGAQAQLVVGLVPELKLIIGEQQPAPDLPPQQARRLFQIALRHFIGVFATHEHPLVLFFDDLQWVDAATLDLLEDLMIQSDLRHIFVIGAYRDNEVDSSHPLARKIETIRGVGAKVGQITLTPLAQEHLEEFVADALHCARKRTAPLAQILHEKTGGNPFFANQFLSALADKGLVALDPIGNGWSWDLDRIRREAYTENVVELMVDKIGQLSAETQTALQQLACLGSPARTAMLATVLTTSEDQVHAILWEAARHDLVEQLDSSYRFIHDRVQEAAYSLVPHERRAETHLRVGRLLMAHTAPEHREETVFDIVDQLNRGAALIFSGEERAQLAELNLIAGKRSRAATAYLAALKYFTAGAALLPIDSWVHRHELTFALEVYRAECEFLTGNMEAAEERLTVLSSRAGNIIELATVESLRIDLYTALDRCDQAIGACIGYLLRLGVEWSTRPTRDEVQREYDQIWANLGSRSIEGLITLPSMSDPVSLATLDVLIRVFPAALFTDVNFLSLAVCRAINLSLERGHCDGSCVAYVFFGKIAGPQFGNYAEGFRFARLGYELVEKCGLDRFQARTYLWFAQFSMTWTRNFQESRALLRRAAEAATKVGDLSFVVYSFDNLNTNFLAAGDPLADAQRQGEHGLELAQKARFDHMIVSIKTQLAVIRSLRGLTYEFGHFDDGQVSETQLEERFAANPFTKQPECWYWIRKLQTRFFAGDYSSALDAAERARHLLWTSAAMFETAEYHFYAALAQAASCDPLFLGHSGPAPKYFTEAPVDQSSQLTEYRKHVAALTAHHKQLGVWAENCPENFENRVALVGAEIARIEDRELDAQCLYETAIRSARTNGFLHNEAVAYELAARFYAARGFDEIARFYLRNARYAYLRWGADGKVRQLDAMFPQLGEERLPPDPASTIGTPIDHLDLATVIKVSNTVSREIVLETVIDTTMRTAVEQAGAERGVLLVSRDGELRCVAEASTGKDTITVELRDACMAEAMLPQSVVRYAIRTRDAVTLDDASAQQPFAADPNVRERRARSILCLPLLTQAKLVGLLYLENNLASRVFVPARAAVLKLLASQAATALENARLYRDVAEREAKVRRLVDANMIGTFIWKFAGPSTEAHDLHITEANDAFLDMVAYNRDDLAAGHVSRLRLTPPEWHARDVRILREVQMAGSVQPFEKEYLRKDGSRVPVLVGLAAFDGQQNQGVAFVLDLTERKRAEFEAREAQMGLAHANRVAAVGQLSASIGHEINQPLSGVVTNGETGLLWLKAEPPNLQEAVAAFSRVVRDGKRASEIVNRIRALVKKAPLQKDNLHINEAIHEVVALTHSEAVKTAVLVRKEFVDKLPPIQGDRIQLQQVVLNLVMNAIEAIRTTEAGPREIVIQTSHNEPDSILVSVRDTGPGFDSANIERMFNAFYTTKPGGLGLGLSICRSIIEAHGGRLWATPGDPKGAVFQFILPSAHE